MCKSTILVPRNAVGYTAVSTEQSSLFGYSASLTGLNTLMGHRIDVDEESAEGIIISLEMCDSWIETVVSGICDEEMRVGQWKTVCTYLR